jgi:serine O-acetyltransferase
VRIYTGAIIYGGITIGDRAVIGAGAVVRKDVPPDCTVAGNPAFIVKRNGEKVHIPL